MSTPVYVKVVQDQRSSNIVATVVKFFDLAAAKEENEAERTNRGSSMNPTTELCPLYLNMPNEPDWPRTHLVQARSGTYSTSIILCYRCYERCFSFFDAFFAFLFTFSPISSSYICAAVSPGFLFLLVFTLTTGFFWPSFVAFKTCFSASAQPGAASSISYLISH